MIRVLLPLLLILAPMASRAVVLVKEGRPAATIVVDEKAPDSVRYAAQELQDYVRQVSGATLPIAAKAAGGTAIYLGESAATKRLGVTVAGLKRGGFRIKTGPSWVAIVGTDYSGPPISGLRNPWRHPEVFSDTLKIGAFGDCGTLSGVYRFIEDVCGIRWYMPGDLGIVVPKASTISVGAMSLAVSPDFEYRYPWLCNFAESERDARWFRRAGFGAPAPAQCIDSFAMFLKHKDAHPEWFALIDGKRDFTNLSCVVGGGNLCLSAPGIVEQWVDDICAYFKENPSQTTFPLSPNDGLTRICECPECQKQIDHSAGELGRYSDYIWGFVDKVARGVAKRCPGKCVGAIAYEGYNSPPAHIQKLSANVAVMICQSRSSFVDPKAREQAATSLRGWHAKASTIYVWEYYLFSWPPMRGFPVFFPHVLAQDLLRLKGVSKGEFIEAESSPGGPTSHLDCPGMAHLNLYLTAKLQWNAGANVDALLEDYYARFYGPAKGPMKAFWTAAEQAWIARGASGNPVNIYLKTDLDRLSECLEKAIAATPEGSDYRKRVELIRDEFAPAKRKVTNPLVVNAPKLTLHGPAPAPKIDGKLDDEVWKAFEPFAFVDNDGGAARYPTWGYGAWDEQNLYLAFLNYDPDMAKLTTKATRRDQDYGPGMWDDDSIEVFLAPDPAKKTDYVQFIVNAKGLIWDAKRSGDKPADLKWDSRAEAVASIEPNRWVLEMRIPLADLGLSGPAPTSTLRANFYRNRYCGGPVVYSGWSPTLTIQHANVERFGTVELVR